MIIVDTETGGLDPEHDALLSVAAIHIESGSEFYHYVRPYPSFRCNPDAEKKHGISIEFLESQGLVEADVMSRFSAWLTSLAPQDWAGCNPAFDQRFLDAAFERSGLTFRMGRRPVCIQTVAYMADRLGAITLPSSSDGLKSRSLDSILLALGLSRPSTLHDALEDCRYTMHALQQLLMRLRPAFPIKSHTICSRPKNHAGNGGEMTTPPQCPGTAAEAALATSGVGCEPLAPAAFLSLGGTRYEWDGLHVWRTLYGPKGPIRKHISGFTAADAFELVQSGDWRKI
jgi:DNA polymerase III epsilon subunit-like protein